MSAKYPMGAAPGWGPYIREWKNRLPKEMFPSVLACTLLIPDMIFWNTEARAM